MRDIERIFAPLSGEVRWWSSGSGRGGGTTGHVRQSGLATIRESTAPLSQNSTAHLSPLDMTTALKYGSI